MSDKLLAHISVDIYDSGIPEIKTEKISRETEKCVYVWRKVRPRREIRSLTMERAVQRNTIGRVYAPALGIRRAHVIVEGDVKTSTEYIRALTEMLAQLQAELRQAWEHLDALDEELNAGNIRP